MYRDYHNIIITDISMALQVTHTNKVTSSYLLQRYENPGIFNCYGHTHLCLTILICLML